MKCCESNSKLKNSSANEERIVLVGNPNVGKSALMNQLTGIGAEVSNYPGTTVEVLEGKGTFTNKTFHVADLPGVYSLHSTSEDERVALNYIKTIKPNAIINILDATKLERNLFLTLQLLNLHIPIVVALNFHEEAKQKGIEINQAKLSKLLNAPVVFINVINGFGVYELLKQTFATIKNNKTKKKKTKKKKRLTICSFSKEKLHSKASLISTKVIARSKKKITFNFNELLDKITTEPLSGTIIMIMVFGLLFTSLFTIGGSISRILGNLFEIYIAPSFTILINIVPNLVAQEILRFMFIDGLNAGLQIAIPFVFVFYAVIAILEDIGYFPRVAFLLDNVMHKFGLHGKSIIPMMLGFGCSVPAIMSTRTLENLRERLLTAILITLIPCSARTAVILGAVGVFVGWQHAALIYAFILILILATGIILGKLLPGERLGLIMELPPYRMPNARNIIIKTWLRVRGFVLSAFPLILFGSGVLGGLKAMNLLEPILTPLQPIISDWLLLPLAAGITLFFGILRKELALEMLIVLGGSANLLTFMSPLQIFVFSLVTAIYVPCIATIGILKNEFGWKNSLIICISTIILAIIIGGIVARILPMLGLLN